MIKTGVALSANSSPLIIRLLNSHPDVELAWVTAPGLAAGALTARYPSLTGEIGEVDAAADLDSIDLYIGPLTPAVRERIAAPESRLRAILTGDCRPGDFADGVAALGVAEYNRKALVRGARVAMMPDTVTLLATLALMPLARNLLLRPAVQGALTLPDAASDGTTVARGPMPDDVFDMARTVLTGLQTSATTRFEVLATRSGNSTFAAATLGMQLTMSPDEVARLYADFYGDHRHVVLVGGSVSEAMVRGTNKTVISLRHTEPGRLWVSVGFDAAFKAKAGGAVHLLNLLFGLDERTGLTAI